MQLTLEVSEGLAKKIKALSILTGQNASELTANFSNILETHIQNEILISLGVHPEAQATFERQEQGATLQEEYVPSVLETETTYEDEDSIIYPAHAEDTEDENEELKVGESLSDHTDEELDVELPTAFKKELSMPLKTKEGEKTSYEDPLMADIQAELEDGSLDGQSEEDYIDAMDDDEAEFEEDAPPMKRSAKARVSTVADDTPKGEYGEQTSPDVLPIDLGIRHVSSEEGDYTGAMDFFISVVNGASGDKSLRNGRSRRYQ